MLVHAKILERWDKKKRLVTRQEGITLLRLPMKSTPLQFWSFFSLKSKRKPIPDKTQWNGVGYCNYTARIDAFSRFFLIRLQG